MSDVKETSKQPKEKSKQPKYKEIKTINGEKVVCLNDSCTQYRYFEDSGNLELIPRDRCELKYKPEDWVGFKDELLTLTTQMLRKGGKQRIVFEREPESE